MARSILTAIRRIKSEVAHWLTAKAIQDVCTAVGHAWRERVLDPVTTIQLFVLQILHGNTACAHVSRLGGVGASGEAYGQARARLPLAVFERLLGGIVERLRGPTLDDGRWRGHRTFLADGSSLSMPDTPELQKHFGQPGMQKAGCGFPIMHVLALFHAATGLLIRVVAAPLRTHDLSQIGQVHPELAAGDVLGDRAFCSFAHLALLKARQIFGVFRVHQKQIVDFRPHRKAASAGSRKRGEKGRPASRWLMRLGRHDQLVVYDKPRNRPSWLTAEAFAQLPATLVVRELRYTIHRRGYRTREVTLATTLLDPVLYPATEVAELYGQRWQVETNLRHLKQTLRMDVLRCQTVEGVQNELTMYALVYNFVRLVMLEAADQQQVPVEQGKKGKKGVGSRK